MKAIAFTHKGELLFNIIFKCIYTYFLLWKECDRIYLLKNSGDFTLNI